MGCTVGCVREADMEPSRAIAGPSRDSVQWVGGGAAGPVLRVGVVSGWTGGARSLDWEQEWPPPTPLAQGGPHMPDRRRRAVAPTHIFLKKSVLWRA